MNKPEFRVEREYEEQRLAALAEQTVPSDCADSHQPVAWMYTGIKNDGTEHGPHLVWKPTYMDAMSADKGAKATPLYTAPPQRKPLTDEEIKRIDDSTHFHESPDWSLRFARAIEKAHGIKERA